MLPRRWSALRAVRSPGEATLAFRAFLVAATVPVLFRLPLPRVQAVLEPRRTPSAIGKGSIDQTIEVILGVLEAGRPLLRRGCLTRGATLYYFLCRAGLDVCLCFGMDVTGAVAGGRFGQIGHCWLVRDGTPYLETHDPRSLYSEVYRLPLDAWRAV